MVIVDELYHEEIWKEWSNQTTFSNTSITDNSSLSSKKDVLSNKQDIKIEAKFFIHAKHPEKIKSKWVKEKTLDFSFQPEWNSPEVIRAMLAVLKKAFEDESCGRFVFATGYFFYIFNIFCYYYHHCFIIRTII
jgi:hypothetical protein